MPRSSLKTSTPVDQRRRQLAQVRHLDQMWQALPRPLKTIVWAVVLPASHWVAARLGLNPDVLTDLLKAIGDN